MQHKTDQQRQGNNFDSLRFIFASFVIITHSFSLMGNEAKEFLSRFSNGQLSFSYVGLRGFFIISGFLIYQSFERSKSALEYIWKRFLRVFPGLLTVSFVTAFVAGPFITSLSFGNFFTGNETWLFFTHSVNLLANITYKCLPGVFTNTPYGCEVNGSLWTITYECLFYICLMFLFILPNKKLIIASLLAALVLIYLMKRIYVNPYIKYEYYPGGTSIGLKAACDFG
jgi:peptidoglycan/LPS O-acetylase OafA/YrhL